MDKTRWARGAILNLSRSARPGSLRQALRLGSGHGSGQAPDPGQKRGFGNPLRAVLGSLMLIGLVCLAANGCVPSGMASPTPKRTTLTPTPLPTFTVTPTLTRTPIPTATPTPTPQRATVTPTPLPTLTATPAPTQPAPTRVPSPPPTPEPTPSEVTEGLIITILYDNNEYDERLETAWGFSCLVERGDLTLLFDTGGDAATLLSNMETLKLDPTDIDIVVLSHIHGDHVGGLEGILAVNERTTVYLPQSFPAELKEQIGASARVVEVHEPMEIAEGIYTTGEMGLGILEQSLVVETNRGLVVITGCAHPGIVEIVAEAKEMRGKEVHLVMGGFHLVGTSEATIGEIAENFRELGVQKVAPCHCSGDLARSAFEEAYEENFILAGVGKRLEID
jgi:7,8-dihydropterin-6-yl-methyl-4-(beta-D-ribofuranosyl)aminobenzene 5'-phosphate synthase